MQYLLFYGISAILQIFSFLLLTTGFETTKHKLNGFYSNLSEKPIELIGFLPMKSLEGHYRYKLRDKV